MPSYSKPFYSLFRRNKYFFVGCLAGIVLSSIFMPVLEDCHHPYRKAFLDHFQILKESLQASSEHHDLPVRLEHWFHEVIHSNYNPVILDRASLINLTVIRKDLDQMNRKMFFKDKSMIRDKKLKFYRPRFHAIELNIQYKLVICILIRPSFIKSLKYKSPESQSQSSFYHQLIKDYMNFTSKVLLPKYQEHILYFLPDITNDNNGDDSANIIVSSMEGRNLKNLIGEANQPYHTRMINHLVFYNIISEYSFVLMLTEQTLVYEHNLNHLFQQWTVDDFVLSLSDGIHFSDKSDKFKIFTKFYLEQNWGQDDCVLNYGLLLSSKLISQCQFDWSCYSKRIQDNPFTNWHTSLHLSNATLESLEAFEKNKNKKSILNSTFLYPIHFRSDIFCFVYLLYSLDRNKQLKKSILKIENRIAELKQNSNMLDKFEWPLGVFGYQKSITRYEVIRWTFWNESHVLMPNDVEVVRSLNQCELNELNKLKLNIIQWIKRNKRVKVDKNNFSIENLYRKFDAVRGLEYIADLRSNNFFELKHLRLQIVKSLNPVELVTDVPYNSESLRLTLVLPVRGQLEVPLAIRFLNQYANVCLKSANHQTSLIIALIHTRHFILNETVESIIEFENKEFERLKQVSIYLQSKYETSSPKMIFIDIHPPDPVPNLNVQLPPTRLSKYPSELVYLDLITRSLAASSQEPFLMMHCRSNIVFTQDFLNRVRLNTISNHQVFAPIPFVEYQLRTTLSNSIFQEMLRHSQSPSDLVASINQLGDKARALYFDVRKDNGYFDETNGDVVAFYLSDYVRARKQTQRQFPLARNHRSIVMYQEQYYNAQFDLLHLFLFGNSSSVQTINQMRSVEPDLKLFYDSILTDCDYFESNIFAYQSCLHRLTFGLGPKQKLASILLEYLETRFKTI